MFSRLENVSVALAPLILTMAGAAFAADKPPLIGNDDPVALPGAGRVIFGFAVTALLAFGVAYGLKKWLPRFASRSSSPTDFQPTVHTVVKSGLRLHVVKLDQHTVLVAEGKSGIGMTVLPAANSAGSTTRNE